MGSSSSGISTSNSQRQFPAGIIIAHCRKSIFLANLKALLDASVEEDVQTFHFLKVLDDLGLQKSVDVVVRYESGETQTIRGLSTIDEDKLSAVTAEQLVELNRKGYLIPMHAMLISIFQLNQLVRRQGKREDLRPIAQVKLELAKDATSDY